MNALTVADLILSFDEIEQWRPVVGFPGYEVSSWGRVSGKKVEILVQWIGTGGYRQLTLMRDGKPFTQRVSRLVATAFLGPPPFDDAEAAHNDGDPSNNRVSNLRWTNAIDNQADVGRHGNRVKGSKVYGAKLSEEDIPKIRERVKFGERYANIAADFGVSIHTISLIKLGKVWNHVT